MSGVLPNSFMNLSTSLTSLYLDYCELQGEFPLSVLRLPNLDGLYLPDNPNLTGFLPIYNWTSPLRYLSLSGSRFIIDLPQLMQTLKYLNELDVSNCNFTGKFPAQHAKITQIPNLYMSQNHFEGQIPFHYLNLENLTALDLSYNNFVGTFPEICRNSTRKIFLCDPSNNQLVGPLPLKLESLELRYNLLNGTIPSWLFSLPSLEYLSTDNNRLTGQIQEFQFNSLKELDLSSNKLQGFIPRSIFQQVNLSRLNLASNNVSGVVKMEQFSKLKNLQFLDLSFNKLSAVFKSSINYTLPSNLHSLYLSSCNISEFPYQLRSLENLRSLSLSNNRIQGSVPQWFWDVGKDSLYFLNISHNSLTQMSQIPWTKNLEFIDLRSNQLEGPLPIPPRLTFVFIASDNHLSGEISSLICNLSFIEVLHLSNNGLSGNIPLCIGNSFVISVLDLRMNKFIGVIPSFSEENSLTTLNLNGNMLEGSLSKSLLNCQSLQVLDVGNNRLNGTFPHWLESLPELQVLILRSNGFHGSITSPRARFPFQKLRIMDISGNKFTGSLPAKYLMNFKTMMETHTNSLEYMESRTIQLYYQDSVMVVMKGIYVELVKIQKMFITIDFSGNIFTGEIPEVIGELKSLKGLNLSHNRLMGPIPTSFGNLFNLEWLDLSSNELVGKIPMQLATNLYQLSFINVSSNQLEGAIPGGKQFNTFTNDSYRENPKLCGFPLSKSCGEPTEEHEDDDRDDHIKGLLDWKIVFMGYACGVVIGVSLGYIVFFGRRFDYWLAKRIGRAPHQRHISIARFRGRGRN